MINSLSCDFLIRIKNANLSGRENMTAPFSQFCVDIAKVLKENGLIADYKVNEDKIKTISVDLAYNDLNPAITNVDLFSKPGRRLYEKASSLPWGKTPESLILISTSSGLLTQRQAAAKKLGGEVIAEIY